MDIELSSDTIDRKLLCRLCDIIDTEVCEECYPVAVMTLVFAARTLLEITSGSDAPGLLEELVDKVNRLVDALNKEHGPARMPLQ